MSTGRQDKRSVKSRRQRAVQIPAQEHGFFVFQQVMSKHLEQRLPFSLTSRSIDIDNENGFASYYNLNSHPMRCLMGLIPRFHFSKDEYEFSKIATPPRAASDSVHHVRPGLSTKPHVVLYTLFKPAASPMVTRVSCNRTKSIISRDSRCLKRPSHSLQRSGCFWTFGIPRHFANADQCYCLRGL